MEKLISKLFKLLKIYLILLAIGASIFVGIVVHALITDPFLFMAVGEQKSINLENYNDYLDLDSFSFVYRTEYGDPYYSPSRVRWLIQRCEVFNVEINAQNPYSNRRFLLEDLKVEFTIDQSVDLIYWELDDYKSLLSENGSIVLYQRQPFNEGSNFFENGKNQGIQERLRREKCRTEDSQGQTSYSNLDVKYTITNVEGIVKRGR